MEVNLASSRSFKDEEVEVEVEARSNPVGFSEEALEKSLKLRSPRVAPLGLEEYRARSRRWLCLRSLEAMLDEQSKEQGRVFLGEEN